jgi:hypothetical protein
MKTTSHFDLAECLWCGCFTVNPQSDRCECGHELFPVSKTCAPGSRIMGVYLKKESPLAAYASALGLLYVARLDGELSMEEERKKTTELSNLWEELGDDERRDAECLTEYLKAFAG